jgi:hypothetical protein
MRRRIHGHDSIIITCAFLLTKRSMCVIWGGGYIDMCVICGGGYIDMCVICGGGYMDMIASSSYVLSFSPSGACTLNFKPQTNPASPIL